MKNYTLLFILFISWKGFATETSCGKEVAILLKTNSKGAAKLEDPSILKTEFCDEGKRESNANFQIELLDKSKNILYQKNVFLSTRTILEETSSKTPGTFIKTKYDEGQATRIVKFPFNDTTKKTAFFRIKNLMTNNEQTGDLKWKVE